MDNSRVYRIVAIVAVVVFAVAVFLYLRHRYLQARNELPLLYEYDGRSVYGIIDRVVINEHEITLIDYKTHAQATPLGGGLGIWLGIILTFAIGTITVIISSTRKRQP